MTHVQPTMGPLLTRGTIFSEQLHHQHFSTSNISCQYVFGIMETASRAALLAASAVSNLAIASRCCPKHGFCDNEFVLVLMLSALPQQALQHACLPPHPLLPCKETGPRLDNKMQCCLDTTPMTASCMLSAFGPWLRPRAWLELESSVMSLCGCKRLSFVQQLAVEQQKTQCLALELASKTRQLTELDVKQHKVAQVMVLNLSCICTG